MQERTRIGTTHYLKPSIYDAGSSGIMFTIWVEGLSQDEQKELAAIIDSERDASIRVAVIRDWLTDHDWKGNTNGLFLAKLTTKTARIKEAGQ